MGKVGQIEIKSRAYYFYNDIINIEEFDSNLLKIDKKSYKDIDIYYIRYITIKKIDDCKNVYSLNTLYLIIGKIDGYVKEKNGGEYLASDSKDENKEVLKKYTELWNGIKNKVDKINGDKNVKCVKHSMGLKFDTDHNLPLNKQLKLHMLTIIVRSIFEEDGKFYLQLYLGDCLHDLLQYEKN